MSFGIYVWSFLLRDAYAWRELCRVKSSSVSLSATLVPGEVRVFAEGFLGNHPEKGFENLSKKLQRNIKCCVAVLGRCWSRYSGEEYYGAQREPQHHGDVQADRAIPQQQKRISDTKSDGNQVTSYQLLPVSLASYWLCDKDSVVPTRVVNETYDAETEMFEW